MKNAALLRDQITRTLDARVPAAFSPRGRVEPERVRCGIAALDGLLSGGLPAGYLTEFTGVEGSGRTSAAAAYMAAITQAGGVCAWVDVADALDPEAIAASGVDIERLLWVRCGARQPATSPALENSPGRPNPMGVSASPPRHTGGGSPHPRSEGRDMPQAIAAMLHAHGGLYDSQIRREKKLAAPLTDRSEDREEQVDSNRLPARRGDNLAIAPRCAEPQPRRILSQPSGERMAANRTQLANGTSSGKPWQAVDQALRATDLLLQGGGFSAIVLDLGSTPPDVAWRIPLATWFRFRAACDRTRVSLLLLTRHACARSSAELVVRLEIGSLEAESKVMTGIRYRATTERSRFQPAEDRLVPIRKPPQSEWPGHWKSEAAWAHTR